MRSSDSNQAHGTKGSPQTSMDQSLSEDKAKQNEDQIAKDSTKHYDLRTLPRSSPLHIPKDAAVKEQQKPTYQQVKYQWSRNGYKYISRWHERTPNAPSSSGNSWVVERIKPGVGYGPNARPAKKEVYVKGKNGVGHWVSKKTWDKAIYAWNQGTATKQQKEMLKNGHWKAP